MSILSTNQPNIFRGAQAADLKKSRIGKEQNRFLPWRTERRLQKRLCLSPLRLCEAQRKAKCSAINGDGRQKTKYISSIGEAAQATEELLIEVGLSEYLQDRRLIRDLTRLLANNEEGLEFVEELREILSDLPDELIPVVEAQIKPIVRFLRWASDNSLYFDIFALLVLAGLRRGWWWVDPAPY
eukprot:TRINITY_DN5589_c1_g5_i1.p1 TRINITY_DN5589_c1_g5~~TRINITY_DN5589_c1_g5_i1.p1  ORF type:complete len:184 (-),score=20.53 TRINITY_DN5589_c1_g5_i1:493-1044(-)